MKIKSYPTSLLVTHRDEVLVLEYLCRCVTSDLMSSAVV